MDLILSPKKIDNLDLIKAKKILKDKNCPKAALNALRNKNSNEGYVLSGLDKHGKNNFLSAIEMVCVANYFHYMC